MNPLVSIIVPTHNNEATIVRTLNSLIEQTLPDIEVLVVDDASEDATLDISGEIAAMDSRLRILPQGENRSALQTRLVGVQESSGSYVMFCDSDDELEPHAAETAVSFARGGQYDIVHFGTTIVSTTGSQHSDWERALAPFGKELFGDDILLESPFGTPEARINGHVWNKLYEKNLLERAWQAVPPHLSLPRAQDVFQTFLTLSAARRYGGLDAALYRYNFRAGKSGNAADIESFRHFLASARTYEAVRELVTSTDWDAPAQFDSDEFVARLKNQFIENQLRYWLRLPKPAHIALQEMLAAWGTDSVLRVFAQQFPGQALAVADAFGRIDPNEFPSSALDNSPSGPKTAALVGNFVGSGGVQKVMSVQAGILAQAGFQVTVLTFDHDPVDIVYSLPEGASIKTLGPRTDVGTGTAELIRHIRENDFGLVLNHDNYSPLLAWIGAVTKALEVPSALFLHSFALRGLHDFREVFGHLPEIAKTFDITVTLSEADKKWWEASGVPVVRALPNFAPKLSAEHASEPAEGEAVPHPVDLLWVGRLQDDTKNITGALETLAQVVARRPETTMAIVGGEQHPGDRARLEKTAHRLGVIDNVEFVGAVQDPAAWYRSAKVFLATASIEGFNLTLVEALAHGLPIAMFRLGYLETAASNPGIVSVEWGSADQLAAVAIDLLESPDRRQEMVDAGQDFIQKFSPENYEAGILHILEDLLNIGANGVDDAAPEDGMVAVPASMVSELYRLYLHMHKKTAQELRTTRRESTNLRTNLAHLKSTLAEAQEVQDQLQRAITRGEKGNPARVPKRTSARSQKASQAPVGGAWPLWARTNAQTFPAPAESPFSDVNLDDRALLPATWALDAGLIQIDAQARFHGSRRMSRYEFIQLLHRIAGAPDGAFESPIYSDLVADDPAIFWAIKRHIMTQPQTPQDESQPLPAWNPKTPLRRRTAAMLLYRVAGRPTYRAPQTSPYADLKPDERFYKEMCWAAHQGVLPASRQPDGSIVFDPNPIMKRTETIAALFRQMVGPLVSAGSR